MTRSMISPRWWKGLGVTWVVIGVLEGLFGSADGAGVIGAVAMAFGIHLAHHGMMAEE